MLIYVSHLFTFLTGNFPYKQILICINFLRQISVTFLIVLKSERLLQFMLFVLLI